VQINSKFSMMRKGDSSRSPLLAIFVGLLGLLLVYGRRNYPSTWLLKFAANGFVMVITGIAITGLIQTLVLGSPPREKDYEV